MAEASSRTRGRDPRAIGPLETATARRASKARELEHSALVLEVDAQPLVAAARALSDRHRLGVLLQAAALLAHLRQTRLDLPVGWWRDAALDRSHGLQVASSCVTKSMGNPRLQDAERFAHQQLRALLLQLFGARREVAGRGQARAIARRLSEEWCQSITEVPARTCVRRLLDLSQFLWSRPYAVHRQALVARRGEAGRVRLLGPREWRRAVLERSADLEQVRELIASEQAAELWKQDPRLASRTPLELFEGRHWRAAARAWHRDPPRTERERYRQAQADYALGQFERALKRFEKLDRLWPKMYRVACLWQLGEIYKAQRLLDSLEETDLPPRELMAIADIALRVVAAREDRERQRTWVARILAKARGKWRGQGHYWAAMAYLDMGDSAKMRSHLERAVRYGVDEEFAWRLHHGLGVQHLVSGEPEVARECIERALGFRRRLRIFEAGRLWNDLAVARFADGDRPGAERALEHAYRLLSRCEGPVAVSLCLRNLAEVRLRKGQLRGVGELIDRCQAIDRAQNNLRGLLCDRLLEARLETSLGNFTPALAILDQVDAEARRGDLMVDRQQPAALRAEIFGLRGQTQAASQSLEGIEELSEEWVESAEIAPLWLLAGRAEEARRAAADDPVGRLWKRIADGEGSTSDLSDALAGLEPYAGARVTLLAFRLAPSLPNLEQRRLAGTLLRGVGADRLAEFLLCSRNDPQQEVDGVSTHRVDLDLWGHLALLLSEPPEDERALRRWFEQMPSPGLGIELEKGQRRFVFRSAGNGQESQAVHRGDWRWRVSSGPPQPVLEALLSAVERSCPWLDADTGERSVAASMIGEPSPRFGERHGIVGSSPQLEAALEQLALLARGDLPVLVLGETGSGKELAARALHAESPRAGKSFLAVNCAALSETLLLSDLFGHAKGAFTGADRQHLGVFESAEGGTVFLDEIGDLPPIAQGMLLRVLQEGEIRRLGESGMRRVDVRIVAATHRDLEQEVADGAFRRDLFYRLNVGTISLPPLRERVGDARLLAQTFLSEEIEGRTELARRGLSFSDDAMRAIDSHAWPGNVRQLRGAVQRAVALHTGDRAEIDASALGLEAAAETPTSWHEWLEELKRERLQRELEQCGGNQAQAARRLGITRQAMSYLVRQMQLS